MMPDGTVGFVNGRRKTGSFSIADVNGKTIKGGITYKKLRTLSRATTLLTQIMEMA